jgi:hypothetical protein
MYASVECRSCFSKNQQFYSSEVAIHFPGRDGLNKPIVWVFPTLTVCMDCGVAQFNIPDRELQVLATGERVSGALVYAGIAS